MSDVALIFPGQGAQKVGMGKDFYEASPEAKAVFDQADRVIEGLNDIIFNGPQERLTSTAYCQPAILTMSLAALKAFEAHPVFEGMNVRFSAGLSLGEYSALAAAGVLSFEETLKLVRRRAALMEEATQLASGKMAAVIGLDREQVLVVCRQTGTEVANFNSPEQIVITGEASKVEEACRRLESAGAKRVIPLDVSGAFHSSLMQPAAGSFAGELENVPFQEARFPVVSNVDGRPVRSSEQMRKNLAEQITSSVQWVDSIRFMAEQGVAQFIEIGPGSVLKGLIRRIDRSLHVGNIETHADLESLPIKAGC